MVFYFKNDTSVKKFYHINSSRPAKHCPDRSGLSVNFASGDFVEERNKVKKKFLSTLRVVLILILLWFFIEPACELSFL